METTNAVPLRKLGCNYNCQNKRMWFYIDWISAYLKTKQMAWIAQWHKCRRPYYVSLYNVHCLQRLSFTSCKASKVDSKTRWNQKIHNKVYKWFWMANWRHWPLMSKSSMLTQYFANLAFLSTWVDGILKRTLRRAAKMFFVLRFYVILIYTKTANVFSNYAWSFCNEI